HTESAPHKVRVNPAAYWANRDPLKTRAVGDALLAAGFDEDTVDQVLWRNPVAFYGLSGRLGDLTVPAPTGPAEHEGNSNQRGAPPPAGE
ncbi:hydrolase TatD, partial [Streptomyces albidoflavus]